MKNRAILNSLLFIAAQPIFFHRNVNSIQVVSYNTENLFGTKYSIVPENDPFTR